MPITRPRLGALALGLALWAVLLLPGAAAAAVDVQLLGINDFHGHVESTTPGELSPTGRDADAVPAGGAEYLATHVRRLERDNPNTLVVSSGDLIGASPLVSALFHDEPAVEAMNAIGLDLGAIGNHELDEGVGELRRIQRGGRHPDGPGRGGGFGGADFPFLAANAVDPGGRPILPPYAIRRFGDVKVGFIGMTLEGTPEIVAADGIRGLRFLDEARTANRYARALRRQGVRAIVVLLHEGGAQTGRVAVDGCNDLEGPIVPIVRRTSQEVDLFLTGHTHEAYDCVVDGRPVTSASSFGRLLTDVDLRLDARTGEVERITTDNVVVDHRVRRASALTRLVRRYRRLAEPLADRVIGRIAADVTRRPDDSGESAAGNLIADAQLAAAAGGGAVAAFMNPGGVRADFGFGRDGAVTYGEAFTVQPFGNTLVTLSLTGAEIGELLTQQWCGQEEPRVLAPSRTVAYRYDASAAAALTGKPCAGAASPVSGLTIGGAPVDPAATYRVTVNSFLAGGGDGFTVLESGRAARGGGVDADALEAYLAPSLMGAPVAPPARDRIAVVP